MLKTDPIKNNPFINQKFRFVKRLFILFKNPSLLLFAEKEGGVLGLFL